LTRKLAAAAMLFAVTLPTAQAALTASSSTTTGLCHRDVGHCHRSCPPKRAAAHDCHDKAAESSSISSRCSHPEPLVTARGAEFLPFATVGWEPLESFSPLPAARPRLTAAGHARIDPEPPRRSL
jgi:hypothetical protein